MKLPAAIFVAVATLVSTPLTSQAQAASFSAGTFVPAISADAEVGVLEIRSRRYRSRRHRSRGYRSRSRRGIRLRRGYSNRGYRSHRRYRRGYNSGYGYRNDRNFDSFGSFNFGGGRFRGGFGGYYR